MKPAFGALGFVSALMILIVLVTAGLDVGSIASVLIADVVLGVFLLAMFKIRDYRVAHVPRVRLAYEALRARDKPRRRGAKAADAAEPAFRLLIVAATVLPLVTGVVFGALFGDVVVGLATGVLMAIAATGAWGWWLWRPEA